MAIWKLQKTYNNFKRLQQIVVVFAKHGFSHILFKARLEEYLPWKSRLKDGTNAKPFVASKSNLARHLAESFQELGPVFIKLGQLLATRPDIVPQEFIIEFSKLQDNVTPIDGKDIIKNIEQELHMPIDKIFADFDEKAIASGSIGQAHYARLNNGNEIVVKIKRPDIEKQVKEDLSLLSMFANLLEDRVPEIKSIKPKMLVEEFTKTMILELDFITEAAYTAKFGENIDKKQKVRSPKVYWDYVTRNILVIEKIIGTPFTRYKEWNNVDKKLVADELAKCFMKQYFINSFFQADPHPGNLILCPDGYIGVIDFGQVGHLPDDIRRKLCLMLIALSQGDIDFITSLYLDIGEVDNDTNIKGFKQDLANLIDRIYAVPVDKIKIQYVMQDILNIAQTHNLIFPRDFVMLTKSIITLSGVINNISPKFQISQVVKPFTKTLAKNLTNPIELIKKTGSFTYRLVNTLKRVPDDFKNLLDKALSGKFKVVFHHENLEPAAMRAEKAIDRLTLGIILAAIIIGSSIVLTAGNNIKIDYNIPFVGNLSFSMIISTVGFIIAILIGLYVVWGILRDRKY